MSGDSAVVEELRSALGSLNEDQARVVLGWIAVFRRQGDVEEHGEGESVGALGDLLNIVTESRTPTGARMRMTVDQTLNNPNGVVHGGVIYTLVDYCMGRAVQYGLPEGEHCATIEVKISYLAGVRDGVLTAESEIVRQGRSVVFLRSEVTDESGRLVATASGSMFVLRPNEAPAQQGRGA